ncbi:acyl-CoA thioesterase [Bacillus xiapuensis]|uniref:acyl-CoA thioesterase n=1 Tax=Bacillus xiapuensis TaxID=2014075 RepID=UPI000C247817|nr:thioesterase family protein [Bacillus xiapuensis]
MRKFAYIDDWQKWSENFHFFCPVKVRFSETDMFGHLNNTVPFVYFEQARIEFLNELGLMKGWLNGENEGMYVVADLQCDFLKQVFFGEQLNIFVKVHRLGQSSCDLHYKGVNQQGEACFVGRGTLVQISRKTGKALPLSEDTKQKLKQPLVK